MDSSWTETIARMERMIDGTVQETQKTLLERYAEQLLIWNQTYALIGPEAVTHLRSRHLINALTLLPLLPQQGMIADMGAGAGFPSIPLAIFSSDDRQFHLYEANKKKCRFLQFIITELALQDRVIIHNKRIEEARSHWESYECTLCRALADLVTIAKLSRMLLKSEGYCLALKGKQAIEECRIFQASKQGKWFHPPTLHSTADNPDSVIVRMRMVSRETGIVS